jgi:hypothetical protein
MIVLRNFKGSLGNLKISNIHLPFRKTKLEKYEKGTTLLFTGLYMSAGNRNLFT